MQVESCGMQSSLRERGVRLTRQRKLLLDLIDTSGKHLDADTLYQMAKEKDPKLNRVTVYRTLKLLKEGGLVDEFAQLLEDRLGERRGLRDVGVDAGIFGRHGGKG